VLTRALSYVGFLEYRVIKKGSETVGFNPKIVPCLCTELEYEIRSSRNRIVMLCQARLAARGETAAKIIQCR